MIHLHVLLRKGNQVTSEEAEEIRTKTPGALLRILEHLFYCEPMVYQKFYMMLDHTSTLEDHISILDKVIKVK